jgi:hypothetical protein
VSKKNMATLARTSPGPFLFDRSRLHEKKGSINHLKITQQAEQGCQMVDFNIQNPNLGMFWRALVWKMVVFL